MSAMGGPLSGLGGRGKEKRNRPRVTAKKYVCVSRPAIVSLLVEGSTDLVCTQSGRSLNCDFKEIGKMLILSVFQCLDRN